MSKSKEHIEILKEKIDYLQIELVKVHNASDKFRLKKELEETEAELRDFLEKKINIETGCLTIHIKYWIFLICCITFIVFIFTEIARKEARIAVESQAEKAENANIAAEIQAEKARIAVEKAEKELMNKLIIYFDSESYEIYSIDLKQINNIGRNYEIHNNVEKIEVFAYTDISGNKDYNDVLATKRGKNIVSLLIKHGVPERKIKLISVGEAKSTVVKKEDRRVEITVKLKQ